MGRKRAKALSADKLNIVGETHRETRGKRELYERCYCAKMVPGGGYWIEDGFPAVATGGKKEDPAGGGDSRKLRAAHGVYFMLVALRKFAAHAALAKKADDLVRFYEKDFTELSTDLDDWGSIGRATWNPVTEREKDMEAALGDLKRGMTEFRDSLTAKIASVRDRQRVLGETSPGKAGSKAVAALWVELHDATRRGIDGVVAVTTSSFGPALSAAGIEHSTKDLGRKDSRWIGDELMRRRSRRMIHAANGSGRTGVWKVGDLHVADMLDAGRVVDRNEKKPADDVDGLSIMTKQDFDKLLLGWAKATFGEREPWRSDADEAATRARLAALPA